VSIRAIEIITTAAAVVLLASSVVIVRRRRRQNDLIVRYARGVAALRAITHVGPDTREPDRPSSAAHVRVGAPPSTGRRTVKKSPTGRRAHRPNVESIAHRPTLANLPSISTPVAYLNNGEDTGD
jgi:hypothetical protein